MAAVGRSARQLGREASHNLTQEEVRILWSFIHGDVMNPGIRAQLYDNWGFCERHTWAHAVVEIELWESGAGPRGGHQPFDVSVLNADLLARMRAAIAHAHRRRPQRRAIKRSGTCIVCADVASEQPSTLAITHAGMDLEKLTAEANRMDHTKAWLDETMPVWGTQMCPVCRNETAPSGEGQMCRMHLERVLEDREIDVSSLSNYLAALEHQLRELTRSMTTEGNSPSAEADASWIGALAWFTNWSFPLRMTRAAERHGDATPAE